MSFPSLETLCVSAATESTHWKLQRRYLERLPEHAANELLALLLVRQPSELRPATLELFRHCVTRLELRPPPGGAAVAGGGGGGGGAGVAGQAVAAAITFGPDWAAALAGFDHLVELRMSGCSRLTVAALQALLLPAPATAKTRASAAAAADNAAATAGAWQLQPPCRSPAAASLRRLDVSGCTKLGDEAAALMARCCDGGGCSRSQDGVGAWGSGLGGGATAVAAGLVSLDISETSVTGAGLRHLSALTGLTELRAGGLKSCSDADWCALLPHLPHLRRLDAWGTDAGDGGDGGEQLLAVLATTGAAAAAAAAAADDGSSTDISRGGGGCGSSSMGMHRLEQLSLAWTRVRVAPAFPALQVLDLRHCQLEDVWWPGGSGGAAPLPLRQLLLRGAVVSGRAAAAESGIAALVRHAAATLELLDLADVSAPTAAATITPVGGAGGAVWPLPLAALAGRHVDGSDSSGGGCGGGGGHGVGGAPRLTHLDISRTAVPAEQLEELQHAPALAKLVAAGCRGAGCARGAAALVSAGLRQLRELDLSAAGVGDDCVSWLQQLSSLTSLNLSGNTALSLAPPPPPPPLQPPPPPAQEQGQQQQQQQQQQHQDAEADEEERVDAMANVWRRDEGPAAAREEAGSSCRRSSSSSSGEGEDGCSSNGSSHVWPQLLRLNLLGTRVTEAGLRALLSALSGSGGRGRGPRGGDGGSGGGGGDSSRPPAASALEQLKLGGGGFTDGAAAVLAAARLPRLHSLLVRDAPLSGHGALLLAASGGGGGGMGGGGGGGGLTALRRLELQACWLVSPQDAARMADCMAATAAAGTAAAGPPVLVIVNGKAAGAAAAAAPAGLTGSLVAARSGATSSSIATPAGRKAVAAAAAAAAARAGAVASAAVAAAAGDLSAYDQRLRYNRQELITVLATAPLAGGGGGAAGCSWPEELGDAPATATALWGRQPAVGAAAAGTAASAGKAAAQMAAVARAAVVAVLPADLLRPVGAA